jgi:hypothetical protein
VLGLGPRALCMIGKNSILSYTFTPYITSLSFYNTDSAKILFSFFFIFAVLGLELRANTLSHSTSTFFMKDSSR